MLSMLHLRFACCLHYFYHFVTLNWMVNSVTGIETLEKKIDSHLSCFDK